MWHLRHRRRRLQERKTTSSWKLGIEFTTSNDAVLKISDLYIPTKIKINPKV